MCCDEKILTKSVLFYPLPSRISSVVRFELLHGQVQGIVGQP